jgi:hypothetical protein
MVEMRIILNTEAGPDDILRPDLTIAIGLMNAYNRLAIGFRNSPKAATRM